MRGRSLVSELAGKHGLDPVQSRYLGALKDEIDDEAVDERALLSDAAELLAERPQQSWDDLVEALSSPSSFAAAWRAEVETEGVTPVRVGRWKRLVSTSGGRAKVLLVAILLAGAMWAFVYFTAQPMISNSCSGGWGPSVETISAAGTTEYRMPLEIGSRYGVFVCPNSDDDVVFERIFLPAAMRLAIQPVGWELLTENSTTRGDASNHMPFLPDPRLPQVIVWFEGEYCNTDGGISFNEIAVDYRYRGRERTQRIDLLSHYSVWPHDNQCTDQIREADDEKDRLWMQVVGNRFAGRDYVDVGAMDLPPVAVSRDLCRYLQGVTFPSEVLSQSYQLEPLAARAVFQLERAEAKALIDGAVLGICPEFKDQRSELYALVE